MEPMITVGGARVFLGDCRDVLKTLPDNSVDSVVTDPPYELGFMGKSWDSSGIAYDVTVWAECLRVLKPGGHLLAFAGTRTQHRMAVNIEDAGFEIRDMIAWVYGSEFPKSENVGNGWGTALKPALEPITVARKPLVGTVAANVLRHGTGALNVDGCRVGTDAGWSYPNGRGGSGWHGRESLATNLTDPIAATQGRWPANLIHDGSDEVVGLFPQSSGGHWSYKQAKDVGIYQHGLKDMEDAGTDKTTGSAARFFYCAKASKADRDADNKHPTVKPTALMRYLCRLVTPPGGVVLDPFTGSGSTGKAAILEGFRFIGIEREAEYVEIAKARIGAAEAGAGPLFA